MHILFVGFATIDIIHGKKYLGGAAGSMSINAAQLGHTSSLLSILSHDENGSYYQTALDKFAVDYTLSYLNAPTVPTCTIADPHGNGSKRAWQDNGAIKQIHNLDTHSIKLNQFDAIYLANAHPMFIEKIAPLVCKKNLFYIPGPQVVLQNEYLQTSILPFTKLLFANREETAAIQRVNPHEYGVEITVLTDGANGVTVAQIGKQMRHFVLNPVKNVVDPTGAGDIFALGFGIEYLTHGDIQKAVRTGHKLASELIQTPGAILNL